MNVFTVSFFGHRSIDDLRSLEAHLAPILKTLIRSKHYVVFLIGRNGEFDEYTASIIKRVQKDTGKENSEMTLVLPYKVANIDYYDKYYDNIVIPEHLHRVYPKAAIALRNQWMVDVSDLVIVYVKHNGGGAYTAMRHAEKTNKTIINIYKS